MEQLGTTISGILTQIATSLHTTLPHLWAVLIKQAYVNSIIFFSSASLLWLAAFISLLFVVKAFKAYQVSEHKRRYDDITTDPISLICFIISGAFTVAAFIYTSVGFADGVTGLLNPEYMALKYIFQALGKPL